jgi:hypothetical protein
MTEVDLAPLEVLVADALGRRDPSGLPILGFGELSVALAWPSGEPRYVCKRTPPFTPAQLSAYTELVGSYVEALRAAGLRVVDTSIVPLDNPMRRDRRVAYLVQPLLPRSSLGHEVLAAAEPDPDHPFLQALGRALAVVTDVLSIDAQVTNWSWDGTEVTLIDVGTPFLWDDDGRYRLDMGPFLPMIPAPLRPLVRWDMNRVVGRWREARRVALDVVANLYREGLVDWVGPATIALQRALGAAEPLTVHEARAFYDEDRATWVRLKRLQRLERAWQTGVRRRRYEFFIHSTFGADTTF